MSIKTLLANHSSLLLMLIGAGSVFSANIILKPIFSEIQYGQYGMMMTIIFMINSFGLFGTDQAFVRLARIDNSNVTISNRMLIYVLFSISISPIIAATLIIQLVPDINPIWSYLISLGTASTMFFYNYYRILSKFNKSQIFGNGWKIILGVTAFVIASGYARIDIMTVSIPITVTMIFLSIYGIKDFLSNTQIKRKPRTPNRELRLSAAFFFSLLSVSIFSNYDRLFIDHKFGAEAFGEYYYLLSIYTLPLGLIAGYVGFKSLIKYKNNIDKEMLKKDLILTSSFFLLMGVLNYIVIELMTQWNIIPRSQIADWKVVLPLVLIGITRGALSLTSAALGATGNPRPIVHANIYSLLFILFVLFSLNMYNYTQIHLVAWSVVIISLVRFLSYYNGSCFCINSNSHGK